MKITPRKARVLGQLGAWFLRALGATWRVRQVGHVPDVRDPGYVGAFLHGDMVMPAIVYRRMTSAILISQHGDGELIAQVIQRLGRNVPVRGSSTRGGARAMLALLRDHADIPWTVTPDGPRGPRGSVKEGVVMLASESRRKMMAMGFAASSGKRFSSWDRFMMPAPFARVVSFLGEPIDVPADLSASDREFFARRLERELQDAHEQAVRALANW